MLYCSRSNPAWSHGADSLRIAFVSILCFPGAVEVLRSPRLADRPLIIGDAEQPKRVLDYSLAASEQGVRRGFTVRKALGFCPDAVILPPDPVLYRGRWDSILGALDKIAPEAEDEGLGRVYLNIAGLQSLYEDEAELAQRILGAVNLASGLDATLGIGDGKFIAFASAATGGPGEQRIIPAGAEAAFLAPLGIELLPVEADVNSRLRLFGLETIGDVAALSLPELQSQFGFSGRRLWQLANGIDDEPLHLRPRAEELSASLTFEAPVAGIDVMVAAAKQLLSRLRPFLRGRAARELTLLAKLATNRSWERRVVMREAVSDSERLAFVLRSSLMNAPPPNAVRDITLRLGGLAGESGKQLVLGEKGRLQSQLEEAIRQLKARYGHSPVYRCVDVEPWSVIPEERQILIESDG